MTISFMTQTVTVVRPGVVTERGDEFPDWDNATTHTLTGCRLQPMASDEVLFSGSGEGGTARDAVVTRWKLFTPAGPDLTPHDRVTYDGTTYEVDGQILEWLSPTGQLAHGEVILRRVDG